MGHHKPVFGFSAPHPSLAGLDGFSGALLQAVAHSR
jgi:hypothetical protein